MFQVTKEEWDALNEKCQKLQMLNQIYSAALSLTEHTVSYVDVKTHSLHQIHNEGDWNGVEITMPNAPESIIQTGIIHPDDCDGYRAFYNKIYAGEPKVEYTMRVMEEKRGWVWFIMYAVMVYDEEGNPLRAVCFSEDITVEKKAEEKYRQFMDSVSVNADFVWEVNLTKDTIITDEKKYSIALNVDKHKSYSELSKDIISSIPDPIQQDSLRELFDRNHLLNAFYHAKREITKEHSFDYRDGRGTRWLNSTAYLMTNYEEDVLAIIVSNDITSRHNELETLEIKAERDSLTGLFNRSSFEQKVTKALSADPEMKYGFVLIDIDDFKHCNDNYGHAFGDSMLQTVAKVLQRTFRIRDLIGRLGGDEFIVFMRENNTASSLTHRIEDLRAGLIEACESRGFPMSATLSIGATLANPNDDFQSLYLRADQAMYQTKNKGKNHYTINDGSKQ